MEWKEYSISFTVKRGEKTFGRVLRSGKTSWRNYHREIKNGVSMLDVLEVKLKEGQDTMEKLLVE